MGSPGVERGALLGRPVVPLIDPGDAGAAAAGEPSNAILLVLLLVHRGKQNMQVIAMT